MKHEESMDPADWIRIAKEDLARVDVLLSAENPVGAGFYLQQAVEIERRLCFHRHSLLPALSLAR